MSAPALAHLCELWSTVSRHAYLNIDAAGLVTGMGGAMEAFGLGAVMTGEPVIEHLPALYGMLPLDGGMPVVIEAVNLSDTVAVNLHLVPFGDEICVTLVDVSAAVHERQALQQQAHNAMLESAALARTVRELDRARAALEQASRAKTALLTNVSHELRTPLSSILGFSEVLMGLTQSLSADQVRYLQHIVRAGKHLNELINDLLDLSRVELGRANLDIHEISLLQVARDACDMVTSQAQEAGIDLRVDASESRDLTVQADRTRVIQVVTNLLTNAIKYNRAGGWVRVTVEPAGDGQSVRLNVSDSGPGLSAAEIERVFNPFERLGRARRDIEGTGIGLSICASLMAAMSGAIGIDSKPGAGSTFWIEFDAALEGTIAG